MRLIQVCASIGQSFVSKLRYIRRVGMEMLAPLAFMGLVVLGIYLRGRSKSALYNFEWIRRRLSEGRPLIFLDYDGTLTPIVNDPDQANLGLEMRDILEQLSQRYTVVIVTGRGFHKISTKVNLPLHFAASHGFDIRNREGAVIHQPAEPYREKLENCFKRLTQETAEIQGCFIEDNHFSISVHYRMCEEMMHTVEGRVDQIVAEHQNEELKLKKTHGKKVFEIRPDFDWHKGEAVSYLIEQLSEGQDCVPLYIGDDRTDEDAFQAIRQGWSKGVTICVMNEPRNTFAEFSLVDVPEVRRFLRQLC